MRFLFVRTANALMTGCAEMEDLSHHSVENVGASPPTSQTLITCHEDP